MLDPKEKAKEFVNKFNVDLKPFSDRGYWDEEVAKQCALIAVDYIIGSIPTQPSSTEMERMDATMFWINVKAEIELL